jgi:hypothetical protein
VSGELNWQIARSSSLSNIVLASRTFLKKHLSNYYCRCLPFTYKREGQHHTARLVPLMMQHVADIMEANLVANMQGIASQHPMVRTLVPRGKLDDIHSTFPKRTENFMVEVASLFTATYCQRFQCISRYKRNCL